MLLALGSAAGPWPETNPGLLVGRNVGVQGFYLGRLLRLAPELVGSAVGELLALWQTGAFTPLVGAELPLDEVERAHELDGVARQRRQGGARPVKVLITGGSGGLGLAIAAALGDAEIVSLGLEEGFDVGDADAWRAVEGEFDAAFLNAGIVTREGDMAALTDEQYRRALRANVDGVVFGVRELSARLMPNGGSIVATSSLAGLTATPMDPIYALTKHAVIGFVRSVAPQLAANGHSHQRALPGLHRHADRRGRGAPADRRAADGAGVRRGGGAAGAERRGDRAAPGSCSRTACCGSGSRTSRGRADARAAAAAGAATCRRRTSG